MVNIDLQAVLYAELSSRLREKLRDTSERLIKKWDWETLTDLKLILDTLDKLEKWWGEVE